MRELYPIQCYVPHAEMLMQGVSCAQATEFVDVLQPRVARAAPVGALRVERRQDSKVHSLACKMGAEPLAHPCRSLLGGSTYDMGGRVGMGTTVCCARM